MNSIVKFILIGLFFALPVRLAAAIEGENKRLAAEIQKLYVELDGRIGERRAMLDSLKAVQKRLGSTVEQIEVSERLADSYIEVNLDSAMLFWTLSRREAIDMGLLEEAARLDMRRISFMPLEGLDIEALEEFRQYRPEDMSPKLRKAYWDSAAHLYYFIQFGYPEGKFRDYYRAKTAESIDSLLAYMPEGSIDAGFFNALLHSLRNENNLAVANFIELTPSFKEVDVYYESALRSAAKFYRNRPKYEQQYMTKVLELLRHTMNRGLIVPEVMAEGGKLLYDNGEYVLGRNLIMRAMKYSQINNGPYRYFDHSAYAEYLADKATTVRAWLIGMFLVLLVLFAILTAAFLKFRKTKVKELRDARYAAEDLESALDNDRKLITNVLKMLFFSHDQLQEYNLYVYRKLNAGQAKDLFREVDSGDYLNRQNEKFFETFDDMFMTNYPDFVDRVNGLLKPDRQLALLPGKRLTPELRIAAYMRFGITDSSLLSQALGLSINTIYTYRNRLKGRAVDRDNFEENIRNLD